MGALNHQRTSWWAELDSNQRCHTDRFYRPGWYQLHSIDPYITHLFDASYKRFAARRLRKLIKGCKCLVLYMSDLNLNDLPV